MEKSKVAIVKGTKQPGRDEIAANVRRAIELVGGLDGIGKGDVVLIKPNICAVAEPGSGTYTDPEVSRAVADLVREKGARAVIGESSGVADDTEEAIQADGYGKLREEGYEVVNLKDKSIPTAKVDVPRPKAAKTLTFPKIALEARLVVSVPVMKTHPGQTITVAMKNLKGLMPDVLKKKFHTTYGVAPAMVDLLSVLKPGLAVVDGTIAMEGLGPMLGDPVPMGIIMAGKDLVAVDAVAATIMGYDPAGIPLIAGAAEAGLGEMDLNNINVVGNRIDEVKRRFKRVSEALEETFSYPEGCRVLIEEKACTGCRETLLFAMYELNQQDRLDMLAGWTVVTGQTASIPEVDQKKLLLVGNCLARYKDKGALVIGCPPWGWQVINAIRGEPQDHPR